MTLGQSIKIGALSRLKNQELISDEPFSDGNSQSQSLTFFTEILKFTEKKSHEVAKNDYGISLESMLIVKE